MEQVFLTVLNMSITASYVMFRLICPVSFSSALSFFGFFKADTMGHIPADIGYMAQPRVNVGIAAVAYWCYLPRCTKQSELLIVETALRHQANSVILAHNHPSGNLQPSNADIDVTRKIVAVLEAISINVVDHIITAGDKYLSFTEKGLIRR